MRSGILAISAVPLPRQIRWRVCPPYQTRPISAQVLRVPDRRFARIAVQAGRVQDWHSFCSCDQTIPIYHGVLPRELHPQALCPAQRR